MVSKNKSGKNSHSSRYWKDFLPKTLDEWADENKNGATVKIKPLMGSFDPLNPIKGEACRVESRC